MDAGLGTQADEGLLRTAPRVRMARALAWTALAGAVAAALLLPVYSTLQARYYERYPDLVDRMDGWRESTHGHMSCAGCHVDPGAASLLRFSADSIPAFYSQLVLGPRPTNLLQTPTKEACQKCHTAFRQVSPAGDLRIPHKAHVEVLDMDCAECHERLVHYDNDKGFNRPAMTLCLSKCHDGTKATAECVKCHTRKQVPASHRAPDWLATHSDMTEEEDCAECHAWSPDYCDECHSKRPASHAGNWKKDHQAPARERGKGCLVCHGGEAFCKRCHD